MEDIVLAIANEIINILKDNGFKIQKTHSIGDPSDPIISASQVITPGWCGGEIQLHITLKDLIKVVAYKVSPYTSFNYQFIALYTFEYHDNDCLTKLSKFLMNADWSCY